MPPWVATHPTARASQPPVLVQGARPGAPHPPGAAPDFPLVPGMALRRAEEPASDPAPQVSAPDRAAAGRPGWAGGLRRPASLCRLGYAPAPPGQTGRAERDHRGLCHPDRHLEGHRRGFRGRRRIFGQLRVQRRRWNSVSRLGCTDHHPIAVRILNQVGGIPRRDHALATSRLGQRRRRRSLAYVAFQRFLVLLQHPGPLPGVAQLVGPLGGIGGQPQCEA